MKRIFLHTALLSSARSALGQLAAPITARADAGPAPTITLEPRSDYIKSPDPSIAPTGTQVVIIPTEVGDAVPAGGIDIFFGPDTSKKLRKTLDEKCASGATSECHQALISDINAGRQYDLAKRVVGIDDLLFLGAAALVGIISTGIALYNEPNAEPVGWHVESSILTQVQSQTGASVIVVTASDDAAPVTVPMTATATDAPTATGAESATITTLTADANGHHKGDVLVAIPTGTADLFEQLIAQKGQCPRESAAKKKRGPGGSGGPVGLTTVTDVAQWVLPMAAPGAILDALALQAGQRLPELRDAAQQASLDALRGFAATLPDFNGVAADLRDIIADGVWWGVYDYCVGMLNDLSELVLEEQMIVEDKNEEEDGEGCPKDAPKGINAPLCETCDGSDKNICGSGQWKGCMCLGRIDPWYYPGGRDLWDQQQRVLEGLLSDKGGDSSPDCDTENRLNIETNLVKGLSSSFCKDFDLSKDKSTDLTSKDGGDGNWDGYSDYNFHFEWKKQDGQCSDSCVDVFGKFVGSSCAAGSHAFASSGSMDTDCGTASFKFTEGDSGNTEDPRDEAPTQDVDLGILTCGTHKDQGNPTYFTTLDSMNDAIERFCSYAADQGRKFSSGSGGKVDYHYNNQVTDPIYVAISWRDADNCPVLDFGGDTDNAKKICKARLGNAVNLCDTNANGKHWWKQGGNFFRDCAEWKIVRDEWRNGSPSESDDWRPPATCSNLDDCREFCGDKSPFCASANGPGYCSCMG